MVLCVPGGVGGVGEQKMLVFEWFAPLWEPKHEKPYKTNGFLTILLFWKAEMQKTIGFIRFCAFFWVLNSMRTRAVPCGRGRSQLNLTSIWDSQNCWFLNGFVCSGGVWMGWKT